MIDTSAMVADAVASHEHHRLARPHLTLSTRVPVIVLAETYSQLRRTFAQPARVATDLLSAWAATPVRMLETPPAAASAIFGRAVELDLGGNVHDALIAATCRNHAVALVTLDVRQHRVALELGASCTYLLA